MSNMITPTEELVLGPSAPLPTANSQRALPDEGSTIPAPTLRLGVKTSLPHNRRDSNDDLAAAMPRMKVSWLVLAMIHGDDDAEEPADLRHPLMLSRWAVTLSGAPPTSSPRRSRS